MLHAGRNGPYNLYQYVNNCTGLMSDQLAALLGLNAMTANTLAVTFFHSLFLGCSVLCAIGNVF